MMAGMEDYFGPRRKGAFSNNIDRYERVDINLYDRDGLRWDDRGSEGKVCRPNVLRSDQVAQISSPPILKSSRVSDMDDEDVAVIKYIKTGVSIITLTAENLLSHPFVVLRRQCQVHNSSEQFHLFPMTLVPVIWRLNQRQRLTTLWKGLGSVFMVRGMSLAIEDVISKFTPWPKQFKLNGSLKAHSQHLMLKCITFAIVTPFYSASLVETVQSDIASEKPGVLDVFQEGICRLISWGSPQKGRMLPVWSLVFPSVVYGLFKYLIGIMIHNITSKILQLSYEIDHQKKGALPKDYLENNGHDIEVTAGFVAAVGTEVILYPLETILHRLHLQGTRTIIDNLDSGTQVVPILTNYASAVDCYHTTLREEGVAGLYKGFGALILQLAAHFLLIKITKTIMTQATNIFCNSNPPRSFIDLDSRMEKPPSAIDYNSSEA